MENLRKRYDINKCVSVILVILVALVVILLPGNGRMETASFVVNGSEEIGYWWLYKVDQKTYPSFSKVLYIPETIEGYPITGIGKFSIANISQIEEIVIGDYVEWLSERAIVDMPNLKRVYIGKNVSSMRYGAFTNCPLLEEVVISPQNPYFASEKGFILSKDRKTLIRAYGKSNEIPKTVEVIDSSAFIENDMIETITIPDSVKCIEYAAFMNCKNLKEIYIPESVQTIESLAFMECTDLKIYLEKEPDFDEGWNYTAWTKSSIGYEVLIP